MKEPTGPGSFCWFELATTNPASAKRFYKKLFGWDLRDDEMPGGMTYTQCFDAGTEKAEGQGIAALFGMSEKQQQHMPPAWNVYVSVPSAEEAAVKVEKLGGKIISPAFDVMDFGRMAILMDPQGAVFQVWEAKSHPGTSIDYTKPGRVCWLDLMTRGVDGAKKFYGDLFGWSFPDKGDEGAAMGDAYHLFRLRESSMGGFMEMDGQEQFEGMPPCWIAYFAVDDVDWSEALVKELGGKVSVPATDLPGIGRFSVVEDPEGAAFTLFRLNPDH